MQGDYPPLYMTLLALMSYLPAGPEITTQRYTYFLYDMFYVKTLSFIFDFVLAFGIYKLVSLKIKITIYYVLLVMWFRYFYQQCLLTLLSGDNAMSFMFL